jgi:Uncharacterized protein conserved in bacteria
MDHYENALAPPIHMVDQVIEFNRTALNLEPREIGLLSEKELEYAMKAIKEEMYEFKEAHDQQDLIGAVDAIFDKIYFGIGFLYRMGLNAKQIKEGFAAVHHCNMAKKVGVQHKRGGEGVVDAIKPEGWTGPEERIAQILGG